MTDPQAGQVQESIDESSVEDMLQAEFDRMADEDEKVEEVEVSEEETEAVAEEPTEESEEEIEASEEVEEVDEIYNEPAPERWAQEIKDVYNSLPPEARKAMLEGIYKPMQQTYTQNTMELAEMRKGVEGMLEDLNNYRPDFERQGIDPGEAFRRQMAWAAHFARVGPEQGIADMAKAYKVEPGQGQQEASAYLTPIERQLKQEVSDLKNLASQFQQQQMTAAEQRQHEEMQAREAEARAGLETFINETTNGKPTHPHFEQVAPQMKKLIDTQMVSRTDQFGRFRPITEVMQEAYDTAVRLDDSIRPAATHPGQVKRVKAANRGVVAKTPAGQVDVPDGPIEDDISRFYDQLNR